MGSLPCLGEDPLDLPSGRRKAIVQSATVERPAASVFRDVDNGFIRVDQYMQSESGYALFTRTYLPCVSREPRAGETEDSKSDDSDLATVKGLVCHLLGFQQNADWMVEASLLPLVRSGFVVFTLDHFGHGRSDGLWLSHQMQQIIADARTCFSQIRSDLNDPFSTVRLQLQFSGRIEAPKVFDSRNCFLMGYSMGGGVCVQMSFKDADDWRGMVLVAPMLAIKKDSLPSDWVIWTLSKLALVFSDKQWVPRRDLTDDLYRDKATRKRHRQNPVSYNHKMRLGNALSMVEFSQSLEERLKNVALPFYVLQGTGDKVTELEVCEKLCDVATASDKTLKTYEDAWHSLFHDSYANEMIFADIGDWLQQRLDATVEFGEKQLEDGLKAVSESTPLLSTATD